MQSSQEIQALDALRAARTRYTREELASELGISVRRIERWEQGSISDATLVYRAINDLLRAKLVRVDPPSTADFTFIDLFAGIGGTRLGFEHAGGRCVFTSEYDRFCAQTYRANFRPDHPVTGDIREITRSDDVISSVIPDHEVLVAGFPCQPFSIAGVSKKNALAAPTGSSAKRKELSSLISAKLSKSNGPWLSYLKMSATSDPTTAARRLR